MSLDIDKNLVLDEDYYELFDIAKKNNLKVVFQAGLRPGPWSAQGPDSLSQVFGGERLEACIFDCIENWNKNWS